MGKEAFVGEGDSTCPTELKRVKKEKERKKERMKERRKEGKKRKTKEIEERIDIYKTDKSNLEIIHLLA